MVRSAPNILYLLRSRGPRKAKKEAISILPPDVLSAVWMV